MALKQSNKNRSKAKIKELDKKSESKENVEYVNLREPVSFKHTLSDCATLTLALAILCVIIFI